MKKYYLLILLLLIPFAYGGNGRALDLFFIDGWAWINSTDICVSSGSLCLSAFSPSGAGNCSVSGSCSAITYDTEFNNGTIIRNHNTTWVYASAPHTNRTDADIITTINHSGYYNITISCQNINGTDDFCVDSTATNWNRSSGQMYPAYTEDNISIDTNVFFVDTRNNRVAIGTASPTHQLDIGGTTVPYLGFSPTATNNQWAIGSNAYGFVIYDDTNNEYRAKFGKTDNAGLSIGTSYFDDDAPSNGMIVEGNVGIKTPSPVGIFHVAATGGDVYINDTDGDLIVDSRIGIANNNPSQALDVNGNSVLGGSVYVDTGETLAVDFIQQRGGSLDLTLRTESGTNQNIVLSPDGTGQTMINSNINHSVYNTTYQGTCKRYTNSTPCIIDQCGSTIVAVCP